MTHLFSAIFENLPTISLADLNASASLMCRKTTKYLVRSSQAIDFVSKSPFLKVLDVSPSKSSVYHSIMSSKSRIVLNLDNIAPGLITDPEQFKTSIQDKLGAKIFDYRIISVCYVTEVVKVEVEI